MFLQCFSYTDFLAGCHPHR